MGGTKQIVIQDETGEPKATCTGFSLVAHNKTESYSGSYMKSMVDKKFVTVMDWDLIPIMQSNSEIIPLDLHSSLQLSQLSHRPASNRKSIQWRSLAP